MTTHHCNLFNKTELKNYWENTLSLSKFVGYVWMSNAPLQHFWYSPKSLIPWDNLHPENNFIWEANLYEKDQRSIFIQQVNEKWKICEVIWNGSPELASGDFFKPDSKYIMTTEQSKKLLFKEAWVTKKDPYCCNMEVLQPAWRAFIGFEKEGETK